MTDAPLSFTCPICHTSSAPSGSRHDGYCGHCHDFTAMKATVAHRLAATMFDAVAANDFRAAEVLLGGLTTMGAPYVAQTVHWLSLIIRGTAHEPHGECPGTFGVPLDPVVTASLGASTCQQAGVETAHEFVRCDAAGDGARCSELLLGAWESHTTNTGDYLADFIAALLVGAVECAAQQRRVSVSALN